MSDMELLRVSQKYTEALGDDYFFLEYYSRARENCGVRDSVLDALYTLYGSSCPLIALFSNHSTGE